MKCPNGPVPGGGLDSGVVIVDLLDESEKALACFGRGYCRHNRILQLVLDGVPPRDVEEDVKCKFVAVTRKALRALQRHRRAPA